MKNDRINIRYIIVIWITILTGLSAITYAQGLPGKTVKYFPSKYILPSPDTEIKIKRKDTIITGMPWMIFSDKIGNYSFDNTSDRRPFKKLDFLEAFYVMEDKGKYIHIVKDEYLLNGVLSDSAKDYGWVSISDMLLWYNSLVDPLSNKKLKGIFKNKESYWSNSLDNQIITSSSLVYIFKLTDSYGLVGYDYQINHTVKGYEENFGWVPLDQIMIWKENLALKPNGDDFAINERRLLSKPVRLFKEPVSALSYFNCNSFKEQDVIWDDNPLLTGNYPQNIFFPVINRQGPVYNVTYYGNMMLNESIQTGYMAEKSSCTKNPFLIKVVLMTDLELTSAINNLKEITTNDAYDRSILIDKIINLINKSSQEELTDEQCRQKRLYEVFNLLFNSYSSTSMAKITVSDINNNIILSDIQFKEFIDDLSEKTNTLLDILNDNLAVQSFRTAGQKYYWIPEEFLP